MTLTGIRWSLLVMVGLLFLMLVGIQFSVGNVMGTDFGLPALMVAILLFLLAEIVQRVDLRLREVEEKLKNHVNQNH